MRRLTVLALLATASFAGCGGEEEDDPDPSDARGPNRTQLRVDLDARPDGSSSFTDRVAVREGQIVQIRLRVRNTGALEAVPLQASIALPRSLKANEASQGFRPVGSPEPIFPLPPDLTSRRGVDLGPLPPFGAGAATLRARVVGGGGGTLRAKVASEDSSASDQVKIGG